MENIKEQAKKAISELIEKSEVSKGDLIVVGCSTSEIIGEKIGSNSSFETAKIVFDAIYEEILKNNLFLAAQCCEHLNRALIIEKEVALKNNWPIVCAVPKPKAGGSFATCAYEAFNAPVTVEKIEAKAGLDIGQTLIGMHLSSVAVPLRISIKKIGNAIITCAKTRPKYIGGPRTHYQKDEA